MIDRYIRGELSQDEIDELWKIFLRHPEYYSWLETEIHLKSLIRKGRKPHFNSKASVIPASSSAHGYKGWLYAAAAAVILAIGLQFFSLQQPQFISGLALAEIEQSHLMGADVLRSDSQTSDNIDVAINTALATAYNGKTEEAVEQFRQIQDLSPNARQRIRVEMNLGILFYNSGRYEDAKDSFQSVLRNEQLTDYQEEKSWWFLGNTYLNLNHPLEARGAVFNAYSLNGRYQSAALTLLKKLDLRLGNMPSEEAPSKLGE